jgi:hypothetical protein
MKDSSRTMRLAGVDIGTLICRLPICSLRACPPLTVLPWRTIRDQLRRSRPEKILTVFVFQRIILRLFRAAALHLAAPPSPRHEGNIGQVPREIASRS